MLLRSRLFIFLGSFAVLVLALSTPSPAAEEWPQWRGPRGAGLAVGTGYPLTWSETENISWKTPLPGRGWSSPVISGGKVWMTTAFEVPCTPEEEKERLKTNTGDQPLTLLSEVKLNALCVDTQTGKLEQNIPLLTVKNPQWVHQQNSFASPTPYLHEGRLYAHFGTFGTACLDLASAKVLWTNQTIQLMHENGPGSSPIVWRDLVFFHADGSDTQKLYALQKDTGKISWQITRSGTLRSNPQLKKSYATPLIIERDGQPILLSNGADWLYGYDPATGMEKWRRAYGDLGFSLSALPVEANGMVYYSTGFMKPALHAVRCSATGEPELVWSVGKNVPTIPSPLATGDQVFFLADAAFCSSVDAKTGEEHYRERLGGQFNASPLLADGRLYATTRDGVTHVLATGSKFQKLAQNKLPGQQWSTFAAVGGAFYARTDTALYKIAVKK
jgi:outer membrane protein assembly factor BamB